MQWWIDGSQGVCLLQGLLRSSFNTVCESCGDAHPMQRRDQCSTMHACTFSSCMLGMQHAAVPCTGKCCFHARHLAQTIQDSPYANGCWKPYHKFMLTCDGPPQSLTSASLQHSQLCMVCRSTTASRSQPMRPSIQPCRSYCTAAAQALPRLLAVFTCLAPPRSIQAILNCASAQ